MISIYGTAAALSENHPAAEVVDIQDKKLQFRDRPLVL